MGVNGNFGICTAVPFTQNEKNFMAMIKLFRQWTTLVLDIILCQCWRSNGFLLSIFKAGLKTLCSSIPVILGGGGMMAHW